MKILALIPARGGSKGIPDKNKKELGGKPLLAYTIESALAATTLDRVVFSSEDASLRKLAVHYGAEVPFERPPHLAADDSGTLEVVQHALQTLAKQGNSYDAVCLLQVTTPFRSANLIDKAVTAFKNGKTDSLLSVLKVPHEYNPHWVFERKQDDTLQLATGEKDLIKRRQDLPQAYIRDGAIYITRTEVILDAASLYGNTIGFIESDPERYVNIDTMADWEKAVALAKKIFD